MLLMLLIAITSNKLAWEMGAKSERVHARLAAQNEILTERYLADLQISAFKEAEKEKKHHK